MVFPLVDPPSRQPARPVAAASAPTSPTFSIAADDAAKLEGNSGTTAYTFTVSRTSGNGRASVDYTVAGAQPDDFDGGLYPRATVTFAKGETSKSITILIAADTVIEGDETFTLSLSNPVGGAIATGTAASTIQNDDISQVSVERASVASNGDQGDGQSDDPSISADGRYVAFYSSAANLVPDDTNGTADVFVYDRVADTTDRVSVASNADQGDNQSYDPSISADGRYIAFSSDASNLVPDDTNGTSDVFVFDRVTDTTERVSVGSNGGQGSWQPSISADGRYVAFGRAHGSPRSRLTTGSSLRTSRS
ncbi:MAG: hypothetical protein K0S06_3588 [Microvirga sp.]|nr:hypothetical protein [Microvirga sp.]